MIGAPLTPHPDGENTNLAVVAADAQTARDLYVESAVENGWLDDEEISGVAIRVMQILSLGAEYDASPSRSVAWEDVPETKFGPDVPEKEDPEP